MFKSSYSINSIQNRSCSPNIQNDINGEFLNDPIELPNVIERIKVLRFFLIIYFFKLLASTEIQQLISFLPIILKRLFILFTCANSDDLALNTLQFVLFSVILIIRFLWRILRYICLQCFKFLT